MSTECALGLDSGGSKTAAVIVDAEGRELGRGLAGGSNFTQVGLDAAFEQIQQAIAEAAREADCQLPVSKAWFGMAGVARQEDIDELLSPTLMTYAQTILITNDAELGLCALDKMIGVTVIAGTGSIAIGRDRHGYKVRAGGWGYLLGNEGSGYALGQQALVAALRYADGRGPSTLLLDLILQHWQITRPLDVIAQVYVPTSRAKVARLSTCVFEAARQGDAIARAIIDQGAYELALTCKAVCQQLDLAAEPVSLALAGGLLIYEERYRQRLLAYMGEEYALGQIEVVATPALSAARAARTLPLNSVSLPRVRDRLH